MIPLSHHLGHLRSHYTHPPIYWDCLQLQYLQNRFLDLVKFHFGQVGAIHIVCQRYLQCHEDS